MAQLTIRCFGGFEVRLGERLIDDFESNKVRALFAYLATQRDRSFSRDHLAALFWPERPDTAARRNLRQSIYNLKNALAGTSPVRARGGELRLDPQFEYWLDVDAFDEARRRAVSQDAVVPHYLAGAVALYRGDFLAGLHLKDSPDFEFWQLAEQERLRDLAVDTLRVLIESYSARGEFRLGIQYARRLVAIDPLSEHAYRALIRLYAHSGRRDRALVEYEQLRETLHRELGVEPLEETRELYDRVLTEHAPAPEVEDRRGLGPIIPLVGRHEPYQQLREVWQSVTQGRCRLTLVTGEAGIGKTRLVKSFLDAISSRRMITILKGQCSERVPTAYHPFAEVIRNAFAEDSRRALQAFGSSAARTADLLALVPEVREHLSGMPVPEPGDRTQRMRLFECIAEFFEQLCQPSETESTEEPLVLLLAELQWAFPETCELIEYLLERLAETPVWILGTCCPLGHGQDPPPIGFLKHGGPSEDRSSSVLRIELDRLAPDAVEELTAALVDDDQAGELAGFLIRHCGGLPLTIAEWINSLWDERLLVYDVDRWRLKSSLIEREGDLEDLVQKRLRRLPTSTRRLASQAAIMGRTFGAQMLADAANEHPQVVEVGLELMLERWLIRQHSAFWRSGRRERDIVLWTKGARLGDFEFNHRLIWRAILKDINPLRQQIMHRHVATTLEKHFEQDTDSSYEDLSFHYAGAGEWHKAFTYLHRAARKALELSAMDTARHYGRQTLTVAERLCAHADSPDAKAQTQRQLQRATATLEEIDHADP